MQHSASDAARVRAACAVLDRAWGRPPESIEVAHVPDRIEWTRDRYQQHFGLSDAAYTALRARLHDQL